MMLSFPVQLLLGRVPFRVLGQAQLAARYMDRFFQAVNSPAAAGAANSSVQPLVDAEENWPVIESMINDAEKFIFIVSLGLDEGTNLKNTDQHDRPGRPESEWTDMERALKARIEQTVCKWGQTLIIDLIRLYFSLISDFLDISDLTMFALRLTAELAEFCEVKIYYFCCTLQKFSRLFVLHDPIKLGKFYIRFLIIIISKKNVTPFVSSR
jgi:hypothetical protein